MTTRTPITRASATAFANDNRLLRTDGTGRDAQDSGITVDDSGGMQGATLNLVSTTLTGTRAEFNAALSDADFYTSGGTDVAVADGGTGASTAGDARTNLGLGTIATQNANNVTITGGSISGITDVAVADGGTGASTAEAARTNLVVGLPPGFVSVRYAQAADTDHDITFAAGKVRNDADTFNIVLAAALTKQIDAAWAVGTNLGGIDTGAAANNTIYYLWVIARSDTGVVDALFSTSATAPAMPANYDRKQRVGWVRTGGSATILAFVQATNDFDESRYVTPLLDVASTTLAEGARTSYALSVPPTAEALIRAAINELTVNANIILVITPLTETDAAPSVTATPLGSLADFGSGYYSHVRDVGEFRVETNASSQIAARMDSVGNVAADIGFYVATKGAKFRRGIIP